MEIRLHCKVEVKYRWVKEKTKQDAMRERDPAEEDRNECEGSSGQVWVIGQVRSGRKPHPH